MPEFLRDSNYKNPTHGDVNKLPFVKTKGLNGASGLYAWMEQNPDILHHFQEYMRTHRDVRTIP